jgi:hypothetical protein
MGEVLNHSFDILTSTRVQDVLELRSLELETDREALDALARRIGLPNLPLPQDVRILLGYKPFKERRHDLSKYPVGEDLSWPEPHPHDVRVITPELDDRIIMGRVAATLFTHRELSPEVTAWYDAREKRQNRQAVLVAGGLAVLAADAYFDGLPGTLALVAGGAVATAGVTWNAVDNVLHRPPKMPGLEGLEAPVRLVPRG